MNENNDIEENPLEDEYIAFNGLNRPALVMGVPLMLLLPILFVAVVLGFILINFFGLLGVIPSLLCLVLIMVVRVLTENDPNALSVLRLKFKGFFLRKGKSVVRVRGSE